MDCKAVREHSALCFTFHPEESSIFYLTNNGKLLRLVQEHLYTGLLVNEFCIPLKEQNLIVNNYRLTYMETPHLLLFTLTNHILVFSLATNALLAIKEVGGKSPYYIQRTATRKAFVYFTATDQPIIFGVGLDEELTSNGTLITNYIKLKLPDTTVVDICVAHHKLIAACTDLTLRVFDLDTNAALKGIVLERIPCCMSLSRGGQYLLFGTKEGYIQVWDAQSIGVINTLVLNEQREQGIESICWFHYAREVQSKRFLVYTTRGNVKLHSFYFEKSQNKFIGKTNELALLYIHNRKPGQSLGLEVRCHNYFIFFSPGIMLYMLDRHPRIYYPPISSQLTMGFEELIPNDKKEIYWHADFFFIQGLMIKRIKNQIQPKIDLKTVLDFDNLKIIKMDHRPKISKPRKEAKPVKHYKFLVSYHMGSLTRSLIISKVTFATTAVEAIQELPGLIINFIGAQSSSNPLLLTLHEDRHTISVSCEEVDKEGECEPEERMYYSRVGEVYRRQLNIKVHRLYETPFRLRYVVLYQSDNVLRFSNNIAAGSDLIDYDVYPNLQLRLVYSDIVIDVFWSSHGELGCILCLDRAIFITETLAIIQSIPVEGYPIQGFFVGYTVVVTTKVDVQYVSVGGKSIQLYCLDNYEQKYLIAGVLVDRVLGVEKEGKANGENATCAVKSRYLNLMEPVLMGYLSYSKKTGQPLNVNAIRRVIQTYAFQNAVSQNFLYALNKHKMHQFTRHFLESHTQYSRGVRANTLNCEIQMERFIDAAVWNKKKHSILDTYLSYELAKDSADPYEVEKAKQHLAELGRLITSPSLNSIISFAKETPRSKVLINNHFGEQSLFQVYYELLPTLTKMEIDSFKAENIGQWIGLFPVYLQSKVSQLEIAETVEVAREQEAEEGESEDDDNPFANLIVYYRCDDGKGEVVDDLSGYGNQGVCGQECWRPLEGEPMEIEDKWGIRCPQQFSLVNCGILRNKKVNCKNNRPIREFTFSLWVKCTNQNKCIQFVRFGDTLSLIFEGSFYLKIENERIALKSQSQDSSFQFQSWMHLSCSLKEGVVKLYLNCQEHANGKCNKPVHISRDSLAVGRDIFGQITEFRLWKKELRLEQIKDTMRLPLQIVAQKRKKRNIKLKEKKKQNVDPNFFPVLQL